MSIPAPLPALPPSLEARIEQLPPTPGIPQTAEFFQLKLATVRQQIRRGTFPVTIRQQGDGRQYVLLTDIYKFCLDGIPQPQAQLNIRAGRNNFGRDGKPVAADAPRLRGRKSNRQKAAEAAAAEGRAA